MALSSDRTWQNYRWADVQSLPTLTMVVKNAAKLYNGSLCSHDTDQGAIKPFDGTQTDRLVGWHFGENVTGSTTAPLPRGKIKPGGFKALVPMADINNDATDYGSEVYASDDGTYVTIDPGSGIVVGRILADEDRASGYAWVYFRNFMETLT